MTCSPRATGWERAASTSPRSNEASGQKERKAATALLERLRFLETGREAAARAGRYQRAFEKRGRTIHTADALIAGTARAHGAILLTENLRDFPMTDLTVEALPGD